MARRELMDEELRIADNRAVEQPGKAGTLETRVDSLLRRLLSPENRACLEKHRFHGSSNKVYQIPLDSDGEEFIVVKLHPTEGTILWHRFKRVLRNAMYGESVNKDTLVGVAGAGHSVG